MIRALSLSIAACVALAGCGGDTSGSLNQTPPPPQKIELVTPGESAMKVRTAGTRWALLTEKLHRLGDVQPERRLQIGSAGAALPASYAPPAGWSLVDFALHPSGEVTAVLATSKALRLVRLNAAAQVLREFDFADPQALTDPFVGDERAIQDPQSLVPLGSRDAARLAPIGEDFALAIHTGRNVVLAYRYRYDPLAGGFARQWRTLVEPGVFVAFLGITSGTFDPYFGLDNQWRVVMDAQPDGRVAIAISTSFTEYGAGHASHFGEPVAAELAGVLVTFLGPQGERLSTTVVDTVRKSEVNALRWIGDGVAVGGRVFTEVRADGTGWDAFVVIAQPGARAPASYKVVDVDRGDVILELLPMPGGQILAAGSTGYVQNPSGGSISEEASPLLAVLESDGRLSRRVPFAGGPRQNQVRGLAPWNGGWLVAGMTNGPGTHSADANPALLVADGYLRELATLPP